MEQVYQLLEILKQTPEMALWGLTIYFLFILLKLSSWVYAIKIVLQQAIKRFFDYKENKIAERIEEIKNNRIDSINKFFKDHSITGTDKSLIEELFLSLKRKEHSYVFDSDIREAIKLINEHKNK